MGHFGTAASRGPTVPTINLSIPWEQVQPCFVPWIAPPDAPGGGKCFCGILPPIPRALFAF